MEYGDQISNGTWKANDSFKKNSVIEDEAISPQPRWKNFNQIEMVFDTDLHWGVLIDELEMKLF